jgi:nucleoid-associated protein YgaU
LPTKRKQTAQVYNTNKLYKEVFRKRGVKYVIQYPTEKLKHPNAKQISSLQRVSHVWKLGDRYYKLADKYYGDPEYWWVIAWYNQKPTESHLETGDILIIPIPLQDILPLLIGG